MRHIWISLLLTGCGTFQNLTDGSFHDAFPSLLDVNGATHILHRRGSAHLGNDGVVQMITPTDSVTIYDDPTLDDRVGPTGKLPNGKYASLVMQLDQNTGKFVGLQSLVSSDGLNWTPYPQVFPSTYPRFQCFGGFNYYGGRAYVTCYEHDNSRWNVFFMTSQNGTKWTRKSKNIHGSSTVQLGETATYFINDNLWLAVSRDNNGPMKYLISRTQGQIWTTAKTIPFSTGKDTDVSPHLALADIMLPSGPQERLVLFYADRLEGSIKAALWNGNGFDLPQTIIDEPGAPDDFGYPQYKDYKIYFYSNYGAALDKTFLKMATL